MIIRQFELQSVRTKARLVTWLEDDSALQEGIIISLDGDGSNLYRIARRYQTVCNYMEVKRNWGLKLPRSQRTER